MKLDGNDMTGLKICHGQCYAATAEASGWPVAAAGAVALPVGLARAVSGENTALFPAKVIICELSTSRPLPSLPSQSRQVAPAQGNSC